VEIRSLRTVAEVYSIVPLIVLWAF
jgi:hypothetical protein